MRSINNVCAVDPEKYTAESKQDKGSVLQTNILVAPQSSRQSNRPTMLFMYVGGRSEHTAS